MKTIDARELDYSALNRAIHSAGDDCEITGCLGQRFIGAGMRERNLLIRVSRAMLLAHIWTERRSQCMGTPRTLWVIP